MIKDFQPRLYQQTILGTAAHKNTLVVLPTGLGKTALAFLLTAQRLHNYPNSKILMLAPTKPLCEQHVETFRRHLDIDPEKIVLFTGSVKPEKRAELWEEAQIIISTPQGLENDVINKRIKLEEISLLIFDEAHHATKDYAYVWIAQQYDKTSRFSKILALTASPGSDLEKIKEICQNLFIEKVEVRTEKDPDVKPYIQKTTVNWIKVDFPEEFKKIQTHLKECRKSKLLEAQKLGHCNNPDANKGELLGLQGEMQRNISQGIRDFELLRSVSLVAEALKVDHALELLESQGLKPLHLYFTKLQQESLTSKVKAVKNLCIDINFKSAAYLTDALLEKNIQHPKLIKLKEIIDNELQKDNNTKIIIFTQFRDTAEEVVKELNHIPNHIFVGQAKKNGLGFSQKQQKEILDKFRGGEFSTLVATSLHPDEFITIMDPEGRIRIEKIKDFVENKGTKLVKRWKALTCDENGSSFSPINNVIKHRRRSQVVEVTLSSGFECLITEDHSLFTFDKHGKTISASPKKNLFVNVLRSVPEVREIDRIDIVKELNQNLSKQEKEKLFCQVKGLSQPKIRELNSEIKVLTLLARKKSNKTQLTEETSLDLSTITDVTKRLRKKDFISEERTGRSIICTLTDLGHRYFNSIDWLLKSMYYHKRKYRISFNEMANVPSYIDTFFEIEIGVWYGKKTLKKIMSFNEDLARFLGLYVAEGAARLTKRTSNVYLAARKKEMQDLMIKSIKKGIGLPTQRSWRGISIHAQIAYYLVKSIFPCGVGSYNKQIPEIVFNAKKEAKLAFLEGYFLGDGHFDPKIKRIVLTTVSRKLAMGLVFLLRQLGIKKITVRKDHCYRVNIYESLPFARMIEKKGIRNYYSLEPTALMGGKFFDIFGNLYSREKKKRLSSRFCTNGQKQIYFDYIKKIKQVEEQPDYVYDISVEKKERFIGGLGLISLHNSVAEEGLDIPKVDKVIFYEPVPSAIRSIQRRGRTGRLEQGEVNILVTSNTRDEGYRWASHHKEKRMYRNLEKLRNDFHLVEKELVRETTLHKFISDDKVVAVLADHREKDNKIVKELIDLGVSVKTGQLTSADYLVSGKVGIELKKVPDFVASIIDGRLLDQARDLRKNFEKAVLIIEGEEDIYSIRKVHANAIRGMLSSIVLDFQVPILYTKNPKDTASLIAVMAKREQDKNHDFSYHDKKPRSLKEQQEFIVSSLPSIGTSSAKNLLEHFDSIKNLINANKEELTSIEGIGDKTADKLLEVFEEKYKKRE